MADVKISALPAAGTLAATDVLPIVQPTGTVKVSLTQFDGRWVAKTGPTVLPGPLSIGTNPASAGIIRLPAGTSTAGGIGFGETFLFRSSPYVLNVTGSLALDGVFVVGTNPAQSGMIRLPHAQKIFWRNATNTADEFSIEFNSSVSYYDNVSAGYHEFRQGPAFAVALRTAANLTTVGGSLTVTGARISVGTNPAASGIVRLPNNQHLYARNAANDGDILVLGYSSANQLLVGNNTGSTRIDSASQIISSVAGVTQFSVINNQVTFKDDFYLAAGATTGLRIGTVATEKLGFYGKTPIVRPTVPAAATDPATTMALANSLRTALVNLGLVA